MDLQALETFLNCPRIFKPGEEIEMVKTVRHYFRFAYTNRKLKYFDVPTSFDIETSSFFRSTGNPKEPPEKVAIMYEWTLGIFGVVMVGRTWDEFETVIRNIARELDLNENKRLMIYVHNLSYEFQFIRKHFEWIKVFSVDTRKPIYAVTDFGVEFRCSYLLSGYSLEKLGDQLQIFDVKKLVGNLKYDDIRHSKTPLTDDEIAYCVNDVRVVMAYIAERINHDGTIAKIPITKTGYVRNYCRAACMDGVKRMRYVELMHELTIDVDEYDQLKRGFAGGFTHANPFTSGKVVDDVTSYDFTSSYTTTMIAEKFPMSAAELVEIKSRKEFKKNLKNYCCLFDVKFDGLESRELYESYISSSRCIEIVKPYTTNNGRIVNAASVSLTVTEQDFFIIAKMYKWEKISIGKFRRYKKDYLPTDFVKAMLKLYADKTTLKNVENKEIEYLSSKGMLNSSYGMAVTDIVRDEYKYIGGWTPPIKPDKVAALNKYNRSVSRFLFYPWGVWVTAYARRNLFSGICEFKGDYIYSDTDSIKVVNAENHMDYINSYNEKIRQQLYAAMDFHGLPRESIEPKTIKGVKKCLGVWDFDGNYVRFKTLGAKRYMVEYSQDKRNGDKKGKITLTVSGLNKKKCIPYLLKKYGREKIFDHFNDELKIPGEHTGKLMHTYIDDERRGVVTDYLGNRAEYHELSAVHLSAAAYELSLSEEYVNYLLSIENEYF